MKKDKQLTALIEKELVKETFGADVRTSVYAEINWDLVADFIYQIAQKYAEMKVEEVRGKGYAIEMKDFTNKLKQNK